MALITIKQTKNKQTKVFLQIYLFARQALVKMYIHVHVYLIFFSLKKSEVPVYRTMWNYMHTAEPSVFVNSMPEGVERVRNNKGRYAFLLESVYNEYFNYQDPCNTMQVGPNLNNKGYGLATPKGSDLRYIIFLQFIMNIQFMAR